MSANDDTYDVVFNPDHGMGACSLQSHASCPREDCEIARIIGKISEAQIAVTLLAMQCSLGLSTLIAFLAFVFDYWAKITNHVYPVPEWVIAIALAPYGGALVIKIRKKIKWKAVDE